MKYIVENSIVWDKDKTEYKVLNTIGSGGFGIVFKLKRKSDSKIFALKTLQIGFSEQDYLDSFRHEAEVAIQISNDNVLHYIFFHDGDKFKEYPPYIIMEFAEQGSLDEFLKEQKQFISNTKIKSMFLELINGMKAINEKIIHRDLKPANVLISKNKLKITDFGLSKLSEDDTRTSTFKGSGTYSYMSPEAWRLEKNTTSMDIYSMGLIFYEIATLKHPFLDKVVKGTHDWRDIHLYDAPKSPKEINPKLSTILEQLILRMIAKSPSDRFKSWKEVEEYLNKDELPETKNTAKIDEIISIKTRVDIEKNKILFEMIKRKKDKEEKTRLVEHMFGEHIVKPLEKFIDELNGKLGSKLVKYLNQGLYSEIRLGNGNTILISCQVIFKENFDRKVTRQDIAGLIKVNEIQLPTLGGKDIMAWGLIKASSGKGYNIVLVEKEGDPYGKWNLLTNTNNALNPTQRHPEPFSFDYRELEKQLHHINALGLYDMNVDPLRLDKIHDLISEEI